MSRGEITKARNAWNLFLIIQIAVTLTALAQGELPLTIALIAYMICTAIQQSDLAGRMIFGLKAYVCDDPTNAIQIDTNNRSTHRKIIVRYCLDLAFWGILALLAIQLSPEPLLTVILCLIQGKLVVDQLSEKPRKAVVIASHCNPIAIILIQISSNYPYHALLGATAIILMIYEGIIIAKTDESIQANTGKRRRKNKSEKIEEVFETVKKLLTDQEFQNSREPRELRSLFANNDLSADRDLNGYGESPTNPIRVNGVIGELAYISRLADEEDHIDYIGHRLGSLGGEDIYEVVSRDGHDWRILHMNMYWDRRDIIAPSGLFQLDNYGGALSAINKFSQNFPKGFYSELLETTSEYIGIAAIKTDLKTVNFDSFKRPEQHSGMVKLFQMLIECERTGESVPDKLEDLLQENEFSKVSNDFDCVLGNVAMNMKFLVSAVKNKDQSDNTSKDLHEAYCMCDEFFGNKFLRVVAVIETSRDFAGISQELSEEIAGIEHVKQLQKWGWKDVAWAHYVRSVVVKSGEEIVTKDIYDKTSEQLYDRRESYLESLSERSIRVFKGQLPDGNTPETK